MSIKFNEDGLLAPGMHAINEWTELSKSFGFSPKRQRLLEGLKKALISLQSAGCPTVYLDGSFVTNKGEPGDFDACWETLGVDPNKLDPVLLIFSADRLAQKVKFFGELFPAHAPADVTGRTFLDFFQSDKTTGNPKGIVVIDLTRMQL